ncbi:MULTISPECIES: 4-oxalocrotonate tautomerase [unclassified Lysinibacillus]|uniref:4-oxalocrotonate tautomerase n=1 Tax=unclassified Lysinibacillus TaxID=2636778 RepID=UPI00201350A3|nr:MULTISPECIES: 4-oxalocrotonate tautomerase [unclassified Lysinibacillus]MCL1698718.1 4-oxalocrotonate tautomerase [Lysinibacillus sp. BPa_S21]MCL1703144.1 4-oxalocrotonate tautomerase [Lysinibacillus sp. Bpr_S20]
MPIIQVTFIEGRTPEQKERLIEEVSKTVSSVLDAPLETVRVCLHEIPSTHWGIAGKSVQRRQNE